MPRHPDRGEDIRKMLDAKNLNVAQRSKGEEALDEIQIYLADTIGELGIFYRISNIVYVGGSLVEHGGQNPLEPARLNCAIITGHITYNFQEIYSEMEAFNAVMVVKDKTELLEKLTQLFADNKMVDLYAEQALQFIQSKSGVIDNYMNLLDPYLKPLVRPTF